MVPSTGSALCAEKTTSAKLKWFSEKVRSSQECIITATWQRIWCTRFNPDLGLREAGNYYLFIYLFIYRYLFIYLFI